MLIRMLQMVMLMGGLSLLIFAGAARAQEAAAGSARHVLENARVRLRFDTLGRLVMMLLDENQQGGHHSLKWNGKNSAGTAMPSGVYYCIVETNGYKAVQKMLLVR